MDGGLRCWQVGELVPCERRLRRPLGECNDEADELAIRGGSASTGAGSPTPEQAKTQPMPSDDSPRLDEE